MLFGDYEINCRTTYLWEDFYILKFDTPLTDFKGNILYFDSCEEAEEYLAMRIQTKED